MSMTLSIGDDRDDLRISDRDAVDDDALDREDDSDVRDSREDRRASESSNDDDTDEDADTDGDDDRSPDELKAEIRRLRASLAKSNSTGLRRRNQLKELKAAQQAQDAQNDDDTDDDDDEVEKPKQKADDGRLDARQVQRRIEKAKREARAEADRAHTRDLIDTRAESAMARAGADEKAIRLLKRELDYDELELDPKTRTVDGMEEEIDRLRGEFPNLFRSGKTARRRINGGDDRESGKHQRALSPSEVQARQLRGL